MRIRHYKYGGRMDKPMVPVCDVLNSMKGVKTEESCEGHGEHFTEVFFTCTDWVSLAKVQRAVDRRYGGLTRSWTLETMTVDVSRRPGYPPVVFHLHSDDVYLKSQRNLMFRDLAAICLNIGLYHTEYFEKYFKSPNRKHGDIDIEDWRSYCDAWSRNDKKYLKKEKKGAGK